MRFLDGVPDMSEAVIDQSAPNSALQGAAAVPDDAEWKAIRERNAAADGRFFYAVASTGIFCRPSCPSRRPLRRNAVLFGTAARAIAAGFRPCLRCRPLLSAAPAGPHAEVVERATEWLRGVEGECASTAELARVAAVSATVLRRAFQHVLGVTPAEFLRVQRLERFRAELRLDVAAASAPVTTALQNAGFGSTSRLYETSSATLGMTPTSLRRGAPAETIWYTMADSPLGRTLVATTSRGICAIHFADRDGELVAELRGRFPRATLRLAGDDADAAAQQGWLAEAVRFVLAELSEHPLAATFPTDVRATAFKHRVWRALQEIRRGEVVSYRELAEQLGQPRASRAVAAACARNPVALLHPCHRVVGGSGALTGYRWGLERKRRLLERERG